MHHSRQDSSGQVVSLSQRPLPDNIQHSQQTSVSPVGFETMTPAGEQLQTYALDRAATGTGRIPFIHSLVFSLEGWAWQEPHWHTGTLHPGHVLGSSLPLFSPAFGRSHFSRQVPPSATTRETLARKSGTVGEKDVR